MEVCGNCRQSTLHENKGELPISWLLSCFRFIVVLLLEKRDFITQMSNFIVFLNVCRDLLVSLYICVKATQRKLSSKQKILSFGFCLAWALLYVANPFEIPVFVSSCIIYIVFILFIHKVFSENLETTISSYLLSVGMNFCFYGIASLVVGIAFIPILEFEWVNISLFEYNEPAYILIYILISILQFLGVFSFFRIRRFRNGFLFLFGKYTIAIALIILGFVLVLTSWVKFYTIAANYQYATILFSAGIIIVGVGAFIWIRRGIKLFYFKKIKENGIDILERELAEKEHKLQQLIIQNNALRVANHKINHRLSALERSVVLLADRMQNNAPINVSDENFSYILETINGLSYEYQNEIKQLKRKRTLPSTKIKSLDDMFEYFSDECGKSNIEFNLRLSGSIVYMIENLIPQNMLETIIGDHLQNAVIAINSGDSSFRSILVLLGLFNNYYELTIYDSGIPFSSDTLMRLGTEYITSHADIGGSGIGFMTTFETIRKSHASLIINEKETCNTDFSKSVTIRFDGENKYTIETYRPNVFDIYSKNYLIVGP